MRWYLVGIVLASLIVIVSFWYPRYITDACATLGSYCAYPCISVHARWIKPGYELCDSLQGYRELLDTHQALQQKYGMLQSDYVALHALVSYAKDVDREIGWFKKRFDAETAHAVPVMGVHRSDRQHTMLIEGGSNRGIERDMVVLADNLLVGKVVTVYPWYAVVQLITDPASCVSVYGVCSSAHGIARGTGSCDTVLLERVDHLSPVQEKELLLSSGDGLVVPRGYGVGVVESYSSDGLYYSGVVKLLQNVGSLKTCLVVDRMNLLKIS